jgi:hypothetical protein
LVPKSLKLDKQRQSYGSYDKLGSVVDWGVPYLQVFRIFIFFLILILNTRDFSDRSRSLKKSWSQKISKNLKNFSIDI